MEGEVVEVDPLGHLPVWKEWLDFQACSGCGALAGEPCPYGAGVTGDARTSCGGAET